MSWSGRRVMVTGAGGFLGGHLVGALAAAGACLTSLRRSDVDLADATQLARFAEEARPEIVFHLAGHTDLARSSAAAEACMRGNVQTTINLLRALEGSPACVVVLPSSLAVYGSAPAPFHEEQREQPSSPYGVSKLAAERLVAALGFPHVIVRLSTIFGPGQRPPKLIPAVVADSLSGKRTAMRGRQQRRNFLHVDDAVSGLLCAAERTGARGQVINLGGQGEKTVGEVVAAIRRQLGCDTEPDWGRLAPHAGEPASWAADCSKAARLLDWRPARDFATALAETVTWCQQEGQ